MSRLAIEFISVLGLPPVEFVDVAAALDCRLIGLACSPIVAVPGLYPDWSLRGDPALRRDLGQALADHGVALSIGEGFLIMAGREIADQAEDMDILAELGAPRVNVVTIESDPARNRDQFGRFAAMAAERGMMATLEFMPGMPIGTLGAAGELIAIAPNGRLLLDAMHLFRSGASVADVAALDPARIGYAQVCDVPQPPAYDDYATEARFDRLPPGNGDLPLREFVQALPRDCVVGLELPMRDAALAGAGPVERLRPALEAARALLSPVDLPENSR